MQVFTKLSGDDSQSLICISKVQVPCSPVFAITHSQCQGRTFDEVILDLEIKDE